MSAWGWGGGDVFGSCAYVCGLGQVPRVSGRWLARIQGWNTKKTWMGGG